MPLVIGGVEVAELGVAPARTAKAFDGNENLYLQPALCRSRTMVKELGLQVAQDVSAIA